MKFAVLGTGMVGHALASRLIELGHEVTMGSRQAAGEKAAAWVETAGPSGHEGSFSDAAMFGEIVINATSGGASLDALTMAGANNLSGKVLIDVSNPLGFSADGEPHLLVCNTDSLGEQIQRAFSHARVVKTLNTITSAVMVHPEIVPGAHSVFLCGNDTDAKAVTASLLESFGWPAEDIMDIGNIVGARAMEMYFPLWLRMAKSTGSWTVNVHAISGPAAASS